MWCRYEGNDFVQSSFLVVLIIIAVVLIVILVVTNEENDFKSAARCPADVLSGLVPKAFIQPGVEHEVELLAYEISGNLAATFVMVTSEAESGDSSDDGDCCEDHEE